MNLHHRTGKSSDPGTDNDATPRPGARSELIGQMHALHQTMQDTAETSSPLAQHLVRAAGGHLPAARADGLCPRWQVYIPCTRIRNCRRASRPARPAMPQEAAMASPPRVICRREQEWWSGSVAGVPRSPAVGVRDDRVSGDPTGRYLRHLAHPAARIPLACSVCPAVALLLTCWAPLAW